MAEDSAVVVETDTAPSMDMDAAVEQISADLFPETQEPEATPQETVAKALTETKEPATTPANTAPSIPTVRPAPQSWAKDKHAHWGKIDPEAQAYIEQREKEMGDGARQNKEFYDFGKSLQAVMAPYQPLMQSRGLTAQQVVDDMLGSYSKLTQGTMEQRQAYLRQVAQSVGLTVPTNGPPNGTDPQQTPIDPRIQTIEQQLQELRDAQTRQQQAALQAANQKATSEVNAFYNEAEKDGTPKHPYIDEVHKELIEKLGQGYPLQEAYDRAVWDNPVTREKQFLSRFQTETEKQRERARLDALPKQKARGVNVRSQDTQRPPTEPLGSLEDTMRDEAKKIRERAAT